MSASLFNNNIMKSIFFKSENISIDDIIFRMGLIFIPDMVYTYGTNDTKTINIKKKYQFTTNGYTKFMLIDTNDTHYCVNNTFWYWKWDATEDWNKIEKNNSIKINYYGYRIPFLGIFPNIYKFSN
jgi:hypothetical protein